MVSYVSGQTSTLVIIPREPSPEGREREGREGKGKKGMECRVV